MTTDDGRPTATDVVAVVGRPSSVVASRNAVAMGGEMALFFVALGMLGQSTLVPLFLSKHTDNPLAIGALTTAFQLGWLPQLLIAGYVERSARKLPWILGFGVLERLPALGLVLCALASPSLAPSVVIAWVYLCVFGQTFAGGLATIPWLDVLARSVPEDRRGRFMGGSTMAGTLLGAGAAALTAPLLERLPYPTNFAACFGLAFLLFTLGYGLLLLIREPPGPPPRAPRPFREQIGELAGVLVADVPFRRFLGGLSLVGLGTMTATGFLVVYASTQLGATDELAGWYTAAVLVGQVIAHPLLGWLGDHFGFRAVGRASGLAGIGLAAVAIMAPSPAWLLPAFGLLGASQAGMMLARMAGAMQFAPPDRLPTYAALGSALVSLAAAAGPLLGSQIVALMGYPWLFGASLALSVLATAVLASSE